MKKQERLFGMSKRKLIKVMKESARKADIEQRNFLISCGVDIEKLK